jgi:NAD(P)-dependent dehydrogenase (short-subunit alcohol dehydrogenase family)
METKVITNVKLAVIYYSSGGTNYRLAQWAEEGARAAGAEVKLLKVPETSKVGIRVNAIAPGFFITGQNENLLKNEDGSYTERSEKILAGTPTNRFGESDELIGTLLYLVSHEASSFVNGVVIPVDGGFNAFSGV